MWVFNRSFNEPGHIAGYDLLPARSLKLYSEVLWDGDGQNSFCVWGWVNKGIFKYEVKNISTMKK